MKLKIKIKTSSQFYYHRRNHKCEFNLWLRDPFDKVLNYPPTVNLCDCKQSPAVHLGQDRTKRCINIGITKSGQLVNSRLPADSRPLVNTKSLYHNNNNNNNDNGAGHFGFVRVLPSIRGHLLAY